METFTAFDPETEVIGQAMLALVECVNKDHILPILRRHGLEHIEPDRWYPQQLWLDVFRDVASNTSSALFDLVAIGIKFVETARFPEGIDSIEEALIAVNDSYQMNHRGGYAGEMSVVIMGPRHVQVIDHTPYADDFTYGVIYALARRFRPEGTYPTIRHDDTAPCRKRGDDSCTYDITW